LLVGVLILSLHLLVLVIFRNNITNAPSSTKNKKKERDFDGSEFPFSAKVQATATAKYEWSIADALVASIAVCSSTSQSTHLQLYKTAKHQMIGNRIEVNIAGGLDVELPGMVRVRQKFKTPAIDDITGRNARATEWELVKGDE